MNPIRLMTYRRGSVLPHLPGILFPHSTGLFSIYEQTPGYDPVLIVASIDGRPVAKLLGVVRRSVRLFPPSLIKRCEVYGTGEYLDGTLNREELFGQMLEHLTREVSDRCFLVEFRNLSTALFGYRHFRRCGYFPINWLRIYNSLHDLTPEERLDPRRKKLISRALKRGVTVGPAETKEETDTFLKLLKNNYSSKIRKHFPDLHLFHLLTGQDSHHEKGRIFLVKHHGKVIGGSFCIYSDTSAYLCFSVGLRKTYARFAPGTMAVWAAICHAHKHGYRHIEFVDAGLPFTKAGYRNFILSFGGKQVSTRRWFRFRWQWLNRLLFRLYH